MTVEEARALAVLADPTGRLAGLQAATATDYPRRAWIRPAAATPSSGSSAALGASTFPFSSDITPAAGPGHTPGFGELLGDLGIASPADMGRRGGEVRGFLPRLGRVAEAILAANPDARD